MYILERKSKSGRRLKKSIISFEDFEFLMREKEKYEKSGNKCSVYKIGNNGKDITRLTDMTEYTKVVDFDKEFRKGWKQYVSLRDKLVKVNVRTFYVENDILYIENGTDTIEVEMVRKTPRYELRKNGKVLFDDITSQNDLIDKLFTKKGLRNKIRVGKDFI